MALDHIVINTLRGMPEAVEIFEGLGFQLTPRGHHTLGSINHLMLQPGAYLELVGVPETGRQRQEVLNSPLGLNGLVFRSDDADATHVRLAAAGLSPSDPSSFSRPVEVEGQTRDAKFRTVRLSAEEFPAGRVYFCQHLTPDLVWREEWMSHPNGFQALTDILMESPQPASEAERYTTLAGGVAQLGPGNEWHVRDGDFKIHIGPGEAPRFVSVTLAFADVSDIARRADAVDGVTWRDAGAGAGAGAIAVPSLGLNLLCRSVS